MFAIVILSAWLVLADVRHAAFSVFAAVLSGGIGDAVVNCLLRVAILSLPLPIEAPVIPVVTQVAAACKMAEITCAWRTHCPSSTCRTANARQRHHRLYAAREDAECMAGLRAAELLSVGATVITGRPLHRRSQGTTPSA
jgi:hypothetical protein